MRKLILCLSLLIFNYSFSIATLRYVSHSGSNTPPYLTWETAADSIMSAVNISSFGDTIYVANGVYEEQVIMIPGLSLIGAGMDSCVIDAGSIPNNSLIIKNSCLLVGFKIISSPYNWCVYDSGSTNSVIRFNQFINAVRYGGGINLLNTDTSINSNAYIYKNMFNDVTIGIDVFNSNATIRQNNIYPYPNTQSTLINGIMIGAYFFNYDPLVDSNYIQINSRGTGVNKSYGSRLRIKNNLIKLIGGGKGISIGYTDSAIVANNLIIGEGGGGGITDGFEQYIFNNTAINLITAAGYEVSGTVKNNLVINSGSGIVKYGSPTIQYNDSWNNNINYSGFTPDSTNLSVYPMVINEDTANGGPDFHLQAFSPLIDAGDPDILDRDGSRSDIGLYGGPYGNSYKYIDLPPRAPVNPSALLDTGYILIKWNKNIETDFSHYNLYKDTTENFTADSTTFVASVTDTFYLNIIPQGIDNLYFKLTAVDSQGNESEPSEELHVLLTGAIDNQQSTIINYRLYQNYPNPFNPSTKIGYRLKDRGYVKLYVYDIKGELVQTLVNQYQEGGYYEVEFNSRNLINQIQTLSSGVYIYQIMVRNEQDIPVFSDTKKMIYIK